MTTTSIATVNTVMNRAGAEVGLDPVDDPYASSAQHWLQMRYLLQTAGEELAWAYEWEFLKQNFQVTTSSLDSGEYDLPADFMYMIDQTGWERSNNVPLFGPLSAQDWTYLQGRDLVDRTIYASFRVFDGKFNIFPSPPPDGLDITFEYQSTYWVRDAVDVNVFTSEITNGSEVLLFDRTLVSRYLKLKWLDSKGFDTTKAQTDFNQIFGFQTGRDKGAEILSAGGRPGFPYLNGWTNIASTGYGL